MAEGLAGRRPGPVRLPDAVRSVEHDQDGVRVLTDDGEVADGDDELIARPAGSTSPASTPPEAGRA